MDKKTERQGLKYLKEIEEDIEQIKQAAPSPRKAFLFGIMQGMGAVVGSILAVILLGWGLSVFGLIPGFSEVADYLRDISSRR